MLISSLCRRTPSYLDRQRGAGHRLPSAAPPPSHPARLCEGNLIDDPASALHGRCHTGGRQCQAGRALPRSSFPHLPPPAIAAGRGQGTCHTVGAIYSSLPLPHPPRHLRLGRRGYAGQPRSSSHLPCRILRGANMQKRWSQRNNAEMRQQSKEQQQRSSARRRQQYRQPRPRSKPRHRRRPRSCSAGTGEGDIKLGRGKGTTIGSEALPLACNMHYSDVSNDLNLAAENHGPCMPQ